MSQSFTPLGPKEGGGEVTSAQGGAFPARSSRGLPAEAKEPHPCGAGRGGAPFASSGPPVHVSLKHCGQYCWQLELNYVGNTYTAEVGQCYKSELSPRKATCQTFTRTMLPFHPSCLHLSPPKEPLQDRLVFT